MKTSSYPVLLIFSLLLCANASTDTILQGQLITATETIVSASNIFELGFFSPGNGNSTAAYYVGMWYKNISEKTIVWVANREYSFTDSSVALTINADGNLVMVKGKISYSLTNISLNGNTSATLLDSGNFVLRDVRSGALLWQSFDYPTSTLLPGMKLGNDRRNGNIWSLVSWRSTEDPAPGDFSLELDPEGMNQLLLIKGTKTYWTSGTWNGRIFSLIPEMTTYGNYNIRFVSNENSSYFTYSLFDASITSRFEMDISGQIRQMSWLEDSQQWNLLWAQPRRQCDVYAYCGAFSTCAQRLPFCQCMQGFEPRSVDNWNKGDMSEGCVRRVPFLVCGNDSQGNGQNTQFSVISNIRLPVNPIELQDKGASECQSACSSNCSCSAYAYGSDGCSIWTGDLLNVEQLEDGDPNRRDLYLKLAASEFLDAGTKKRIWKWIILASGVSIVLLASAFCYCMLQRKFQKKGMEPMEEW